MSRTSVVVDDELPAKAVQPYGFRTKREAFDYALRRLVARYETRDVLDLDGVGWDLDARVLRRGRQSRLGPELEPV